MSSITTVCRSVDRRLPAFVFLVAACCAAAAMEPGAAAPLSLYDYGEYASLATRPNPEGHVIVFVPSLVSRLLTAESNDGPLTEAEVLALRDGASAMVVPAESAARLAAGRGYPDLAPGRCWEEWQEQRKQYLNP